MRGTKWELHQLKSVTRDLTVPHLAGEMQRVDAYADDDNGLLPALVNVRVKHHQLCPTWLERCRGLTPMLAAACCQRW